MIHCIHLGEYYYIVNPTNILEPQMGNIDFPHPNSTLHTIEYDLCPFIPWHKD